MTGLWHTDTLTKAQIAAAYIAAGGTQADGEAFFAQLGGGATEYARIGLRFDDGALTQYEQGDDRPEAVGSRGHYTITPAGQFVITDPIDGTFTFDVAVGEDGLRLTLVEAHPETPWTATLFGSFEFRRDSAPEPSPSPSVVAEENVDGTYTAFAPNSAFVQAGGDWKSPCPPDQPGVNLKIVLDGGRLTEYERCASQPEAIGDTGRYTLDGNKFIKTGEAGEVETYSWSFANGVLHLKDDAAQNPIYDHDWTLANPPAASPNATSIEGRWSSPPETPEQIKAAIEAAGYDPSAWSTNATSIVQTLDFDSGRLTVSESDDGGPLI